MLNDASLKPAELYEASRKSNVTAFYNPKKPEAYCTALERLINRKVDNLRALN